MSRKDDLVKYQKFYDGDRTYIYNEFVSRRVNSDIATDDRLSVRDFYYQNEIKTIQNTRINFVPTVFDVEVQSKNGDANEGLTKEVLDWLGGPWFGQGRSFWEALPGYYKMQENAGTLFLKLLIKDKQIQVQKPYSEDVTITVDSADVSKIVSYEFKWYETVTFLDGTEQEVEIKEVVDGESYKRYQAGELMEETRHGLDFIPVVIIVRDEIEGSPYGSSGIEELIESQNNVNVALTKRAWATKYNSFQVWCPEQGADVAPGTSLKVTPGALSPIAIKAVGGNIDLSSIENELDDSLTHLYRTGCVPRPDDKEVITAESGVALNTKLEPLKRYTEGKVVYLKDGFEKLISYFLQMKRKGDSFTVVVTYPSLEREDKAFLMEKANFMRAGGHEEEALRILGYGEDTIAKLAEETAKKEEEQAKKQAEWIARYKPGENGKPEVPKDDEVIDAAAE